LLLNHHIVHAFIHKDISMLQCIYPASTADDYHATMLDAAVWNSATLRHAEDVPKQRGSAGKDAQYVRFRLERSGGAPASQSTKQWLDCGGPLPNSGQT
jgi:hypothetical protein